MRLDYLLNVVLAFVAMVFLQGCGGGSEEASKELIKEYEKHTKNLRAAQGRDDCNKAYKETEEKAVAWQKIKGKNQEEKDPLGYTDKVAKAQHKFKARLKICYDDYTDGAMDDGAKALLDSEDAKGVVFVNSMLELDQVDTKRKGRSKHARLTPGEHAHHDPAMYWTSDNQEGKDVRGTSILETSSAAQLDYVPSETMMHAADPSEHSRTMGDNHMYDSSKAAAMNMDFFYSGSNGPKTAAVLETNTEEAHAHKHEPGTSHKQQEQRHRKRTHHSIDVDDSDDSEQ